MNHWRAPYFPPHGLHDYHYTHPLGYNDPNQNPNVSMQVNSKQSLPITPYEHFAKPQHPSEWYQQVQGANQKWNQTPKGLMSYFQDKDGQIDIDKMLNTVGQMANTYHQVSPIVKGIGTFVKGIK